MNSEFKYFEIHKTDGKLVATCLEYPIGAGNESDLLDKEIDSILQLKFEFFALDMRLIEKVDGGRFSNRLVRISNSLNSKSLRLAVCLNDSFKEIFEVVGFNKIYDVVEFEDIFSTEFLEDLRFERFFIREQELRHPRTDWVRLKMFAKTTLYACLIVFLLCFLFVAVLPFIS